MNLKPEKYILLLLAVIFSINLGINFARNSQFYLSQAEWFALLGLIICTLTWLIYKKSITLVLFFLLVFGMVNLAQFETQIGLTIGIGINVPNSPNHSDIQVLSFLLIAFLILGRRELIIHFFRSLLKNTDEDIKNEQEARYLVFLRKFNSLSDEEIEKKRKEPLAPEAEKALVEIQRQRSQTR